jgi:hypothetical protein
MRQLAQIPQRIQIRQLSHIIRRQNKRRQAGQRRGQRRLDMLDAVARKEQGLETRKEGEVPEGRDVVVGEVDCILVLGAIVSLKQSGTLSAGSPSQYPGSQSPGSYALHVANTKSISIQLIS